MKNKLLDHSNSNDFCRGGAGGVWHLKRRHKKINKWDYSKPQGFCTVNETIYKMKRQSIKCDKIFSNHTSDKTSTSKLYNKLKQLNSKKIQITQLKMGKELK